MIRVLVCEDSLPVSQLLVEIINNVTGTASLLVVGVAGNGSEALDLARRLRPDVIAMDVRMPILNGLEATRRIMAEQPTPIILVSELAETDVSLSLEALAAGALLVISKPHGPGHPDFQADAEKLRECLRLMAGVKVVRHWLPSSQRATVSRSALPAITNSQFPITQRGDTAFNEQHRLVAIGASTGGPSALATIISKLPPDFRWPVLITQHIMPGFGKGLAQWLSQATGHRVELAVENMPLKIDTGQIILAPDDCHLTINSQQKLIFDRSGPVNGILPSVDIMFESISRYITASGVVGILLTGMGRDGAAGLKQLFDLGATTIAQDEATSIVYGMPKEAVSLGAVGKVLPLSLIPDELVQLTHFVANLEKC